MKSCKKTIFLVCCLFINPIFSKNDLIKISIEMIQLSFIQTDRALAILQSLGYNVIDFESYVGSVSSDISLLPIINENNKILQGQLANQNNLPIIVKIPDSENITLLRETTPVKQEQEKGANIGTHLGGMPLIKTTTGELLQRLLIVYDPNDPGSLAYLLDLITNKIDAPAPQISLEALVVEIDSDVLKKLGMNYSAEGSFFQSALPGLDSETGSLSPFTFILDRTLLGNATTFSTNLEALISSHAAEILSRPSVLVLDGRNARIIVGQEIPITKTTASANFQETSVEYIPVGITLNLRPRLSNDRTKVTIQVETIISETEQRIGSLSGTSGVLEAPVINNRKVQSFVRVSNNTPFIIGGLISKKVTEIHRKVPILSSIPLLGKLFKYKSTQDNRKEVIVVVTPHVIDDGEGAFTRVIPKDSELFNSLGNRLFPNSYRLKYPDVFDLSFVTESSHYIEKRAEVENMVEKNVNLSSIPEIQSFLVGKIPGADVLIRRMLYNIIEREEYYKYINPDKVFIFQALDNQYNKTKTVPLRDVLKPIISKNKGLGVKIHFPSINELFSMGKTFVRPIASISNFKIKSDFNYKEELKKINKLAENSGNNIYSFFILGAKSERRLYELLILKRVLDMNPQITENLDSFKPGLEILFPAPESLENDSHIIDREIAKFFYEVNLYYSVFELEYERGVAKLSQRLK